MRVLVTGANGFIGRELGRALEGSPHVGIAAVRGDSVEVPGYRRAVCTGDIRTAHWQRHLEDVDVVVHLASMAHMDIGGGRKSDPDGLYSINVAAAKHLAQSCIVSGVKRLIYVSSIGVLGETSNQGAFDNSSIPNPKNPYATSKLEAERSIFELALGTDTEVVIVRPPLVYGPHAPGNFSRLLRLVKSGVPLPFASLTAPKSMIAVSNLADFLIACVDHPAAANRSWVVSDGSQWSTAELVSRMSAIMKKRNVLIRVPTPLLRFSASLVSCSEAVRKLEARLVIDSTETEKILNWSPPLSPDIALTNAVTASM